MTRSGTPAPRPDASNVYGRASQRHANGIRKPVTERGREVSEATKRALMGTIGRPFV